VINKKIMGLIAGIFLILVLVALPLLTACPSPTPPPPVGEAKILKIGCPRAVTGFYSEADTLHIQGDKLMESWINGEGGITINGQKYNVEMVTEDIQGTADGSVSATNKLIYEDGVNFIVGPVVPYMVEGVGTVSEPAKVLRVVMYNCYLPTEFGANTPYTFLCPHNSIIGIEPTLTYLKEAYPEVKKLAWTVPDDGCIPYLEPVITKAIADAGYEVTKWIGWAHTTVDWTPTATSLVASEPDAILMMNGGPLATGGILKALRELGFNGPIGAFCPDNVYALLGVAGPEASTNFFIHSLKADDPAMTPVIKKMVALGEAAGYDITAAPDWMWVMSATWPLIQAIEAAQSTDPDVVKGAFEQMSAVETPYGTGSMCGKETYGTGANHAITSPQALCGLEKGAVVWLKWQPAPNIP
jgi:branched-chain amino acid transport system substrate-binding protein